MDLMTLAMTRKKSGESGGGGGGMVITVTGVPGMGALTKDKSFKEIADYISAGHNDVYLINFAMGEYKVFKFNMAWRNNSQDAITSVEFAYIHASSSSSSALHYHVIQISDDDTINYYDRTFSAAN